MAKKTETSEKKNHINSIKISYIDISNEISPKCQKMGCPQPATFEWLQLNLVAILTSDKKIFGVNILMTFDIEL